MPPNSRGATTLAALPRSERLGARPRPGGDGDGDGGDGDGGDRRPPPAKRTSAAGEARAPAGDEEGMYADLLVESRGVGRRRVVPLLEPGADREDAACAWVMDDWARDRSGRFAGVDGTGTRFVHVYCVPVRWRGEERADAVMVCSCDKADEARGFVAGTADDQHSRAEVEAPGAPLDPGGRCLHVRALSRLMDRGHVAAPGTPENVGGPADPVPLCDGGGGGGGGAVLLSHRVPAPETDPFSRVVVALRASGEACLACSKRFSTSCKHVRSFRAWLDAQDDATLEALEAMRPAERGRASAAEAREAVTRHAIDLRHDALPPFYRLRDSAGYAGGRVRRCASCSRAGTAVCTHAVPGADGTCECGAGWSDADPVERGWVRRRGALLLGAKFATRLDVHYRECRAGRCRRAYEGADDAVFNWSNDTLLEYEVLLQYKAAMEVNGMPFDSFHRMLREGYAYAGCAHELSANSRTTCRALQGFIARADWGARDDWECPQCARLPWDRRVVVLDGKVCGFRWDLCAAADPVSVEGRGVVRKINDFVLLGKPEHARLRECLRRYTDPKGLCTITHGEWDILRGEASAHFRPLLDVVDHVAEVRGGRTNALTCPDEFREFLEGLRTFYPTCGLVPPALVERPAGGGPSPLVEMATPGHVLTPADKALLQRWWPALYRVVRARKLAAIPPAFRGLLLEVQRVASLPLTLADEARPAHAEPAELHQEPNFVFAPCMPVVRPLRDFGEAREETDGQTCTKNVRVHRSLTPGILAVFCPHRVCLGFRMLRRFEGPRSVFEWLVARCPAAPGVVVYDNACALHRYCLKREPGFFARTKFFVDRFHWRGHTGCHEGYNLGSYLQSTAIVDGDMSLQQINTSVAEQINSRMQAVARQLAYSNQHNFRSYLAFYLSMLNRREIAKM